MEVGVQIKKYRNELGLSQEKLAEKVLPCRTAGDIEAAWACGKTAAVLTVENGSALAGRLDRVEALARIKSMSPGRIEFC